LTAVTYVRPHGLNASKTAIVQSLVASQACTYIPPEVFRDLRLIKTAHQEPYRERLWSRPIGLLIPRESTATVLSDTSYGGIGGWSEDFGFLWRITRQELLEHGFPMREIDSTGEAVRTATASNTTVTCVESLHINVLEVVGIILNIWIVLTILRDDKAEQ
jgi:hypothetical protein